MDREIFWADWEMRCIRKNPARNLRVINPTYHPVVAYGEPAVPLEDDRGRYFHYGRMKRLLEEAKRGRVEQLVGFPFGTLESLKAAIFSQ